jgi:hypothetical protein
MTGSAWKEVGREIYPMIRPSLRRWLRRCRDAVADAGSRQEVLTSGYCGPKPQVTKHELDRTIPEAHGAIPGSQGQLVETGGNENLVGPRSASVQNYLMALLEERS